MSGLKNLENVFSFNKEDITPPETVVSEIVEEIETLTHGFVKAEIKEYGGYTVSYVKKVVSVN